MKNIFYYMHMANWAILLFAGNGVLKATEDDKYNNEIEKWDTLLAETTKNKKEITDAAREGSGIYEIRYYSSIYGNGITYVAYVLGDVTIAKLETGSIIYNYDYFIDLEDRIIEKKVIVANKEAPIWKIKKFKELTKKEARGKNVYVSEQESCMYNETITKKYYSKLFDAFEKEEKRIQSKIESIMQEIKPDPLSKDTSLTQNKNGQSSKKSGSSSQANKDDKEDNESTYDEKVRSQYEAMTKAGVKPQQRNIRLEVRPNNKRDLLLDYKSQAKTEEYNAREKLGFAYVGLGFWFGCNRRKNGLDLDRVDVWVKDVDELPIDQYTEMRLLYDQSHGAEKYQDLQKRAQNIVKALKLWWYSGVAVACFVNEKNDKITIFVPSEEGALIESPASKQSVVLLYAPWWKYALVGMITVLAMILAVWGYQASSQAAVQKEKRAKQSKRHHSKGKRKLRSRQSKRRR